MAWPLLGQLLGGLLASKSGGGQSAGALGGGSSAALQIPLDPNKMGGNAGGGGGGNFWDQFRGRFSSMDGLQEMSLRMNEAERKRDAAVTNLAQTVRPRGRIQLLRSQYSGTPVVLPENPGNTALQELFASMRRGGGGI